MELVKTSEFVGVEVTGGQAIFVTEKVTTAEVDGENSIVLSEVEKITCFSPSSKDRALSLGYPEVTSIVNAIFSESAE